MLPQCWSISTVFKWLQREYREWLELGEKFGKLRILFICFCIFIRLSLITNWVAWLLCLSVLICSFHSSLLQSIYTLGPLRNFGGSFWASAAGTSCRQALIVAQKACLRPGNKSNLTSAGDLPELADKALPGVWIRSAGALALNNRMFMPDDLDVLSLISPVRVA